MQLQCQCYREPKKTLSDASLPFVSWIFSREELSTRHQHIEWKSRTWMLLKCIKHKLSTSPENYETWDRRVVYRQQRGRGKLFGLVIADTCRLFVGTGSKWSFHFLLIHPSTHRESNFTSSRCVWFLFSLLPFAHAIIPDLCQCYPLSILPRIDPLVTRRGINSQRVETSPEF